MQPRFLQQQYDSVSAAADGGNEDNSIFLSNNSTGTSASNTAAHEKNSTYDEDEEHIKPSLEQDAKAYLNSFPPQPETEFASTTYATFVDPDNFSSTEATRSTTHYLTNKLRGIVWLDVNSDGVRGSSSNRTMNAMEYDVGVGGVKVELVHCDTDEILVTSNSSNNNNSNTVGNAATTTEKVEVVTFPYEGGLAKRTDVSAAGIYEFPLVSENSSATLSFAVPPGRYYVMFTAPRNFRIIGNMLPLDRKPQQEDNQSRTNDDVYEDATSVICAPYGGEGNAYRKKVEKIGDLDWEGHCGRSIGCFDVGKSFELNEKYPLLELANDDQQEMDMEDYVGTIQNIVALPSRNTLNVGLAQDDWPLRAVQFADLQLTLAFPPGTSDEDLIFARSFAANNVTWAFQKSLSAYFHNKSSDDNEKFDIMGVDLLGSRVIDVDAYKAMQEEQPLTSATTSSTSGGYNECLTRIPQKSPEEPPPREVTYTFTIRGQYDPPPLVKLGSLALQSVNRDPTDLFERLIEEMESNKNESVPLVFQEVKGAVACHLTLEKAPVIVDMNIQCWAILPVMGGPLIECWAVLPVILLSVSIASLLTLLVVRRARRLRLNALAEATKSIKGYLHKKPTSMLDRTERGTEGAQVEDKNTREIIG